MGEPAGHSVLTGAVSPARVKARLGIDGVLAAVRAGHPNRADPGGRALARINSSTSSVPVEKRSRVREARQLAVRQAVLKASRLPCIKTHLAMPRLQRVPPAPPTHHWEGLTQKATAKVPSGHCA